MLKQMVDSGMVPKSELEKVKKEVRDSLGTDIPELIKLAEEQRASGDLDKDGIEMLELFKEVMED